LVGDDFGGHGRRPSRITPPALGGLGVEDNGEARHLRVVSRPSPRSAEIGIGTECVDHRRQLSPQPSGDDLVEHGKGIGGGPLVVFTLADDGA
jgi:hypothetical protein